MRTLILPCETRAREFEAKMLLAVKAAERGVGSVIGAKKRLDAMLDRLPVGVYVAKGLGERARAGLKLARICGHELVLWDEEGLVWSSPEVYWKTKVHGPNLSLPSVLLAWGEENARVWREHPDYSGTPIAAVGNPRMDLLHPALRGLFTDEVAAISQRFGSFVLINTNFSRVNNFQPAQNRHLKWLRENRPEDPRGGFARHKQAIYQSFLTMLPCLMATSPDRLFVLRPHPSESLAVWEQLAKQWPNLVVVRQGNVVPWLLAANAVIHNGCTTAIEAWQLGCPALAWLAERCERYDHPLPNGISLGFDSLTGLVDAVERAFEDRTGLWRQQTDCQHRHHRQAQSLAGLDDERLASDRILSRIDPFFDEVGERRRSRWRAGSAMTVKRLVSATARHCPGSAQYGPYIDTLFPPTPVSMVQGLAARLADLLGLTERPRVEQIGPGVFSVAACSL